MPALNWSLDPRTLPYLLLLLGAVVIATSLGVYAFRRRPAQGAVVFSIQMWGLALWSLSYAGELGSTRFETKLVWQKMQYPFIFVALLAFLGVVLQYSGRPAWLTLRNFAFASFIPFLTTLIVFTNDYHHLMWTEVHKDVSTPALSSAHGPWFPIHLTYCYLLLFLCSSIIVQHVIRHSNRRRQGVPLLVSALAPWMGNALHLAGFTRTEIDPTPFLFTISGIALAYGLIHLRLLDLVPVAREWVIEAMPDGMMVLDAVGRVVDLNPAAREILGLPPGGGRGQLAADVLGKWPDIVERLRDREVRAEITVGEGASRRHYDLRIASLADPEGESAGRVAVWREVTAGRQAREALADEHATLEALIQSSADGILLVGQGPAFTVVNGTALRLLHLPGEVKEWRGRPVKDALAVLGPTIPAIAEIFRTEIWRGESGDLSSGEGEYEAAPHVVRWVHVPVLHEGKVLGRLAVLRDVSEERALERMRDELTHTMVHDLKNPLTTVRGALEVLELAPRNALSADKPLIKMAREGTERILALVRAILDLSELESGRMPLDREVVPLRGLVAETLRFQTPLADEKGINLSNRVSTEQPHLWVDPGLLRRVLQNLVDNAIRFTPRGGSVFVEACPEPESRTSLRVLVTDTGPGVPQELRGQLFQKFVTGGVISHGSGLGLAFCRLAVEAHGGRIWLDGAAEKGATFVFTLPVAP